MVYVFRQFRGSSFFESEVKLGGSPPPKCPTQKQGLKSPPRIGLSVS